MSSGQKKRPWQKSIFSKLPAGGSAASTKNDGEDHLKCKRQKTNPVEEISTLVEEIQFQKKDEAKKGNKDEKIQVLPSTSKRMNPNANWMEVFAPKTVEELALHGKKLAELNEWFIKASGALNTAASKTNGNIFVANMCLVTGPSGCGKTSAVRVLAQQHEFQLQEWINPIDHEMIMTLGDQTSDEPYMIPQIASFRSFLFQASRYRSLFESSDKRLLLVEDFPNALLNDGSSFEEILSDYSGYGRSPLVFIASDSKSRGLNISYNLFPDEIKQKYNITHITFNPVASTIMQKAMKRFCSIIKSNMDVFNYQVPTQSVIDSIALSSQGDVRNALMNLHFAALKGAPDVSTKELLNNSSKPSTSKRAPKKQSVLKSAGRDESVTMLHALGRAFNPKYTDDHKLTHNPEVIAESFCTESKKFLDFLHANYLAHFSNIDDIESALDNICLADVMLQEYRNESLITVALSIATRGVMVANKKPVHSWLPIRGPKRITIGEKPQQDKQLVEANIPRNLYALEYATYVKTIASKKKDGEK